VYNLNIQISFKFEVANKVNYKDLNEFNALVRLLPFFRVLASEMHFKAAEKRERGNEGWQERENS
jgi:hypothetical protein